VMHCDQAFRTSVVSAHLTLRRADNEIQRADLKWQLLDLLGRYLRSDDWLALDVHFAQQQIQTAWELLDSGYQDQVFGIFDQDQGEYTVLLGHLLCHVSAEVAKTVEHSLQDRKAPPSALRDTPGEVKRWIDRSV
jgi:hypothetical protein